MDFFPAQRPGLRCVRATRSPFTATGWRSHFGWQATTASACIQRLLGAAPAVIGSRIKVVTDLDRVSVNEEVEPVARRSSQEASVELVETAAPPHRRLNPLAPMRAFALRVERLATSQHVDVLLDPPGSRLLPLGGTETVQYGKAVLAGEILEHRLRLRPRG